MLIFLDKIKLLNKTQFWFSLKKSTNEALVKFFESVRHEWEDGIEETKVVFIDLKKVFDTVEHNLFRQTKELGIERSHAKFLQTYLSNRQQCVNSGKVYSNFVEVDYGVPQ